MFTRSAFPRHFNRGLALLTALVLVALAPAVRTQTQAPSATSIQPPSFDVISVKPNKTSLGVHGLIITEFTADGFRSHNVPVHTLLLQAYGLHEGEGVGEPASAAPVFDIEPKRPGAGVAPSPNSTPIGPRRCFGKSSPNASGSWPTTRETRECPFAQGGDDKGGWNFKEFVFEPAVPASARRGGGVQMSMGMIAAHECTIPYFLSMLSRQLGRTVIDRTGLTGNYDFTLRWSPDNGATTSSNEPAGTQADTLPSIFSAVQEQLGLNSNPPKPRLVSWSSTTWNAPPKTRSARTLYLG